MRNSGPGRKAARGRGRRLERASQCMLSGVSMEDRAAGMAPVVEAESTRGLAEQGKRCGDARQGRAHERAG